MGGKIRKSGLEKERGKERKRKKERRKYFTRRGGMANEDDACKSIPRFL